MKIAISRKIRVSLKFIWAAAHAHVGQENNVSIRDIPWNERRTCWVACIDLLGFSRMVRLDGWSMIASIYEQSLEQLTEGPTHHYPVQYAWFSDTFLLFTPSDSGQDFSFIESRARHFCQGLVAKKITLRGAMACGEFLAHPEENVFIGSALVDAYRQCEDQDWVGFSLTKTAVRRMEELDLSPTERLNYRFWNVPRKSGNSPKEGLLSLILGGARESLDKNPCYRPLQEMAAAAPKDHVRRKYDHALAFIEKFGVVYAQQALSADLRGAGAPRVG